MKNFKLSLFKDAVSIAFQSGFGLRLNLWSVSLHLSRKTSRVAFNDKDQALRLIDINMYNIKETLSKRSKGNLTLITINNFFKADEAAEKLRHNGLICLTGENIHEEEIININLSIESILNHYKEQISIKNYYEDNIIVINSEGLTNKFVTYEDYVSYDKTVINLRRPKGGLDSGMIDIFNFDKHSPQIGNKLKSIMSNKFVLDLLEKATGDTWFPYSLNIYINESVNKTRGFHVDSFDNNQIKAFLYLTDVEDLDDGPYCYVLGSHKDYALQKINIDLNIAIGNRNQTDSHIVDTKNILPMIAKKGTLIISDQSGSHRGIPQTEGRKRVVAVMNFLRKAK